jgi:alkylhydroperoxidase family enzyme
MSRIAPTPPERYEPIFGADAPLQYQIYAHAPAEIGRAYATFKAELRALSVLPLRLQEIVRLRIAFHNQCRSCMAVRFADTMDEVSEDLVCSLEKPDESPDLTAAERAALDFADRMATDHLSIGDDTFDRLRLHFTNHEIMDLNLQVASYVGYGRMAASLAMIDDLPERFATTDGVVTPWGTGPTLVF